MAFIAGPYTVAYNAITLGVIEDAARMEFTSSADFITSDDKGDTIQDGIYRGGNCTIDMVLQEFSATGAQSAFYPWAAVFGELESVGKLLSSFAKALVLTAVVGTSATPTPITFTRAVLAPGFPISLLLGTRLKNVPLRFQCLPYSSGTPATDKWFE